MHSTPDPRATVAVHVADEAALARLARHRDRLAVAVCPRTTQAISGILPPP